VLSSDQMSAEIEQIGNRCMGTQESLSLPDRFESPHPALSYPGRLMRLLCSVVALLIGDLDRFRDYL
jgi:hypothetical protein